MPSLAKRLLGIALAGLLLAGCVSTVLDVDQKASQPIPAKTVALMRSRAMTPAEPIVVRIFKQESELEIWKRQKSGRYALLKTYPMCRWSGKLGPKTRNGDRQAPEGFYHVDAGMLNPNSQYYLSFNLGFPNRLEAALGYTGEALMVHGACSSSGCYALTDAGVAEIYAVAREAFKGGQRVFQVQAYPFRMTPKNMAANRNDPNYAFWKTLKRGYDLFEVTRQPPQVGYCGRSYTFGAAGAQGLPTDPLAECAPDPGGIDALIASRQQADDQLVDSLVASGTALSAHAYSDGGMHPSFRKILERKGAKQFAKQTSHTSVPISRPEAVLVDPRGGEAD
ncbi:MAG: murein L,D-transpeptidase [Rhizobiaceae bacterium]|nr:murein L,D-transpeptidase [Rhizobiaceae bacterium]